MPRVRHIPATLAHAADLAADMRPADREEIWASDRQLPFTALAISIRVSEFATATLFDDRVAFIWGVREFPGIVDARLIWLLSSDLVDRYPVAFMRYCKTEISRMLETYPTLCNMVDARYERSIRWLRRLGFMVLDPVPYGVGGSPFHFVIRRREPDACCNGKGAQASGREARQVEKAQEEKRRDDPGSEGPFRVWNPQKDRLEAAA